MPPRQRSQPTRSNSANLPSGLSIAAIAVVFCHNDLDQRKLCNLCLGTFVNVPSAFYTRVSTSSIRSSC
eukprot:scaffold37706_cov168-Amphora_coffeaeformis.AAC.1